jgi:DMSO reductase anchor subunit
MIYVDTRRSFWRFSQTFPRFIGTGTVLALAIVEPEYAAPALALKLAFEAFSLRGKSISARLLRGPLRYATILRYALGLTGAVVTYYITNRPGNSLSLPLHSAIVALLFASELAERYLFFRAVDSPKMPGMPSAAGSAT